MAVRQLDILILYGRIAVWAWECCVVRSVISESYETHSWDQIASDKSDYYCSCFSSETVTTAWAGRCGAPGRCWRAAASPSSTSTPGRRPSAHTRSSGPSSRTRRWTVSGVKSNQVMSYPSKNNDIIRGFFVRFFLELTLIIQSITRTERNKP